MNKKPVILLIINLTTVYQVAAPAINSTENMYCGTTLPQGNGPKLFLSVTAGSVECCSGTLLLKDYR